MSPLWRALLRIEMREREMQVKQIETTAARQFVIVLDEGEEAIACLQDFAGKYRLPGAEFTGLGAFHNVTLGFFDFETKAYERIRIDEQVELVTVVGNLA
ncbi:MAG TPA: PPC domain-containing DNA-binding protein [Paracoccaceae bacterium]|nr:PPC domain-containing DNA-binding protein [Paracoccaceae bacterium]